MLQYFLTDNNDAGQRWALNPCNKNIIVAAELEVKNHDQVTELSTDKTLQLEFSSEEFDKFW
jgi:hypothetical protein